MNDRELEHQKELFRRKASQEAMSKVIEAVFNVTGQCRYPDPKQVALLTRKYADALAEEMFKDYC